MDKEILQILKSESDEKFANWLKPYINLTNNTDEIVLGIRVPILRKLASVYKNIEIEDLINLLHSKYHEARMLALFIMLKKVKQFPEMMCKIYLDNLDYINNWDLIDYTAPHIVAPNVSPNKLRELFESDYLWATRVAIVSTIYYIKRGDYQLILEFAQKTMQHPHHLIHKATGWMLREVGKKDNKVLKEFLLVHKSEMPSIMKNYANEKLKIKL